MTWQRLIARGAVFSLLLLSGCHIPDLCCPDPGQPMPDTFDGALIPGSSARAGVDEFFCDPVLTQLIVEGIAQNQELKIRNQEVWIANNEILARKGAYLPFIGLRARGGMDRNSRFTPIGAAEEFLPHGDGGEFPDPLPNIRLTTDLFWRIDLWKELRNARDAAVQRYYEAIDRRNYLITRIVADIADNYYELAALDKRLQFLNQTIEIQKQNLEVARAQKTAGRVTELPVQRFLAEVRKNESQRLIIVQNIIETESRINVLAGRFPQPVARTPWDFITLDSRPLCVGVPPELLLNRLDIQAAEREIAASGLDVASARARFFPRLDLSASVGYEAFSPKYLFHPEAFIANVAGDLVAPLINRAAIKAEYATANARQLQAVYDYQRTVITAFTEVINSMNKVQNYRRSVAIKQEQVRALEVSVDVATNLFLNARTEYGDVLFTQRELLEARTGLIETKQEQLSGIVNTYQALGGGFLLSTGMTMADIFCAAPGGPIAEIAVPPYPGQPIPGQPIPGQPIPGQPVPANPSEALPSANGAERLPVPPELDETQSPRNSDGALPPPGDVNGRLPPLDDSEVTLPLLDDSRLTLPPGGESGVPQPPASDSGFALPPLGPPDPALRILGDEAGPSAIPVSSRRKPDLHWNF